MERFFCSHCHKECGSVLGWSVHHWTEHLHHDVALAPDDARAMLRTTMPYAKMPQWAYWLDMKFR